MATSVGTEDSRDELVGDLVKLDNAAIAAYDTAIEQLSNASHREKLREFRSDHHEHTQVLGVWLRDRDSAPPEGGGVKELMTSSKVAIAALLGDKQILQAMKTNEDDTNTAYERAFEHREADGLRDTFAKNLEDEQRHRAWIEATLALL